MTTQAPVIIIGAGMAGLSCAVYLQKMGVDALILEASDGVGGRVRTDLVDGFRLDRGFQILLTAYPEAQRLFNYGALQLKTFRSGALIHHEGQWMKLINPMREPSRIFQALASPVGTFGDKLRIIDLLRRVQGLSTNDIFQQPATTTLDYLAEAGFSEQMLVRFFRPFFGGIFLEDALQTSSNFFEFCYKMFYTGDAAIPANGMGQLADQLAAQLKPAQIRLNAAVAAIDGNRVKLVSGETLTAKNIVMAVDKTQAAQLLGQPTPTEEHFNHTTCTYFAAPTSPRPNERLLILNTKRTSAIHNLAILSDVSPAYAPDGQALVSVSTQGLNEVNEQALTVQILKELTSWFGEEVKQWRHLRSYHIPHALTSYPPESVHQPLKLAESLYQCGDHTAYPSLNAALQTGRLVAEAISK